MSKPGKQKGETDRARILLEDEQDVRYWTREFRVTADQLRGAIAAAGTTSATRIREFLRTSGMI